VRMCCRLAVVGAGPLVGVHHCRAVVALQNMDVELACICEKSAEDNAASQEFACKMYTDVRTMVMEEELDGLVLSTPTHLHLQNALDCFSAIQARRAAGLSVLSALLVEKPICESLSAAQKLVEAAQAAGVRILVGHQRRHSPLARRTRDVVQSVDFGPLRGFTAEFAIMKPDEYFSNDPRLSWRKERNKGGPALINMIHDVDLIRYITGDHVTNVYAVMSGAARNNEVEDTGAVTLTTQQGAIGTFFFSDAVPSPWSYEFTSRENTKYPPVGDRDCYHFMGAQRSLAFPTLEHFTYGDAKGWDEPLVTTRTEVERKDPIVLQMAHFVRLCRGEEESVCDGHDAVQSLAIVMAAIRSAETGVPVKPSQLLAESVSGTVGINESTAA